LQALAATASGYYPENGLGQTGHPYPSAGANAAAAFYSSAPPNTAYGPVYYAAPGVTNDYEIRKRAAYDALNEFFGDAKRRIIDPSTYYDVGQRLAGLSQLPLPGVPSYAEYGSGGPMVASAAHPPSHHQYSLPLPNLRTKSDLLGVDQFLDQLQQTVYENSSASQLAASGVAAPGAHYIHPHVNYRSSHSPPSSVPTTHTATSHAHAVASMSAPATETPALTPASSVLSYQSSHSPSSVHSSTTISPTTRSNMPSMYPTLPSVSAMSDMASAYPATSGAPSTGLGTSFSADGRRRFSGGLLQKSAPGESRRMSDDMDTSSDIGTPKEQHHSRRSSTSADREMHRLNIHSPGMAIDPSLRSPASSSDGSQRGESWVENIRTIERLRDYIRERLENGYFDDSGDEDEAGPSDSKMDTDEQSLYPVLRAVQESA
jgi:hypothetical protein